MPRRSASARKVRVSITVDPSIHKWVLDRVGPGKKFGTVTHAYESGIVGMMQEKGAERGSATHRN